MEKSGVYVVGIAGGSASGKTLFLNRLRALLPDGAVCIVSQDNYYRPREEQARDENGQVNYDLPTSIDREAFMNDVRLLMSGQSITRSEYTFNNPNIPARKVEVKSAPIIVVEGLFVFHYAEIRHLLNLRVYLDVREEIKLQRRIERDATERGYDESTVRYQWEHHVLPSFKKFLKPYRDDSHIIITNNITFDKGLEVLADHLRCRQAALVSAAATSVMDMGTKP